MNQAYYYIIKHRLLVITLLALWYFVPANAQVPVSATHLNIPSKEISFVHTDKESYLAGEILWYKIYLLNSGNFTRVTPDNIVYIEVINNKHIPVIQSKVEVHKGLGDGSLYLPVSLSTGAYTLIAYTSSMKEAGNRAFFKKRITVTNTLASNAGSINDSSTAVTVNFFPEGGDLIYGLVSKTGIQVLDTRSAKGLQASGYILENETDTVAKFETLKFGLGQFVLAPQDGKRYTAVISSPGRRTLKAALPTPKRSGHLINVSETSTAFKIIVSAQRAIPQTVYLVAHTGKQTKQAVALDMVQDNSTEYTIEKSRLDPGITYFTLFNADWQPVSERLVYIPQQQPAAAVKLSAATTSAATRAKIEINLEPLLNGADSAIEASVAVYAADKNSAPSGNIKDHLLLTGALSGTITSPDFYFTSEAAQGSYFENLMLVNGWRRFNTDTDKKNTSVAIPENAGHIISALVTDRWTQKPAPGIPCFLTVPSVPFGLYNATSDSSGMVRFIIKHYFGPGEILVKPFPSVSATGYDVRLLSPFADSSAKIFRQHPFFISPADSLELLNRSIAMQANNIYLRDTINNFNVPVYKDTLPFYGKAEISYLLDNYKRFSTMEEVLREYVTPINVTARDKKLQMSIYDDKYQNVYRYAVLTLLDGVPLTDYNAIFNYDPLKVRRLDVIPRRYVIGSSVYSGIASFITYATKFDGVELDPAAIPVDYEGLELKRQFFTPVYNDHNKGNTKIPDYRTTLLWKPYVSLINGQSATLECYSSDYKGNFKVVLQGISATGTPVFSETEFEVK